MLQNIKYTKYIHIKPKFTLELFKMDMSKRTHFHLSICPIIMGFICYFKCQLLSGVAYGVLMYLSMSCSGGRYLQMYLPVWCHRSRNIKTRSFWSL